MDHFLNCIERSALVVACSNDSTTDWLMSAVVNLELDGVGFGGKRQGGGIVDKKGDP